MDIEIPQEIADAEAVPDDLNANDVGPFLFPNPGRRRLGAAVYAVVGAFALISSVTFLPGSMAAVGVGFLALAAYQMYTAVETKLDEMDALNIAGGHADFAVGHASAALRFVGIRSYPVWNVLMYDAGEPPSERCLVLVDAVTGKVREAPYTESIEPEVS